MGTHCPVSECKELHPDSWKCQLFAPVHVILSTYQKRIAVDNITRVVSSPKIHAQHEYYAAQTPSHIESLHVHTHG